MVAASTGSPEGDSDDSGDDDNRHALLMQPSDQAVGQFASSEMEVNEGYVRSVLGEQALGLGRGRCRSHDIRS